MTRLHFSLLGLAGFVTAAAVGCWALINASHTIANAATTVLVVALSLTAVAAITCGPRRRGFWIGFAVCGWLYVLVIFGPLSQTMGSSLVTTSLLFRAAAAMPEAQKLWKDGFPNQAYSDIGLIPPYGGSPDYGILPYVEQRSVYDYMGEYYVANFVRIGQVVWALLVGFFGAIVGQVLYARRNDSPG
jgi:hypothetical protein